VVKIGGETSQPIASGVKREDRLGTAVSRRDGDVPRANELGQGWAGKKRPERHREQKPSCAAHRPSVSRSPMARNPKTIPDSRVAHVNLNFCLT